MKHDNQYDKRRDSKHDEDLITIPFNVIEPLIFRLSNTSLKYMSVLEKYFKAEWFEERDLGNVLALAIKYHEKLGKLPSKDTLMLFASKFNPEDASRQKEIKMKIDQAMNVNASYDDEFIDSQIIKYLKNRGLFWTIMHSMDEIEKTKTVDIEKFQTISAISFDRNVGFDYFEKFEDHVNFITNPVSTISTGFRSLDDLMGGGMPKDGRCLITILAPIHVGKSMMMSNMAAKMLSDGKFILIVSLEMSEMVYAKRVSAHLTNIGTNDLVRDVDLLRSKVYGFKEQHADAKLVIKEFPPDTVTCANIKAYVDELITTVGKKPDAIFVDYLGLILPGGGIAADNLYLKGGKVAKQLRAMSYVYQVPVITASQLNRGAQGSNSIEMSDTSESIAVPADSDFVLALYINEGDRELGVINGVTLKNRFTGILKKVINFEVNYNSLLMSDVNIDASIPEKLTDQLTSALNINSASLSEV